MIQQRAASKHYAMPLRSRGGGYIHRMKKKKTHSKQQLPSRPSIRRSSSRCTDAALHELASYIVNNSTGSSKKNIVIITGAGLSVASGIRPFRSNPLKAGSVVTSAPSSTKQRKQVHVLQEGLWDHVIWKTATRAAFRKDPSKWYREFWIPHFRGQGDGNNNYKPNLGHRAIQDLLCEFQNVKQITQNIDGLQQPGSSCKQKQFIEVHGRAGLFKCCPESDSDSDESDDDDDDRPVVLGHRGKSARHRTQYQNNPTSTCPYRYLESLTADQVVHSHRRLDPVTLSESSSSCSSDADAEAVDKEAANCRPWPSEQTIPCCPACGNVVMPQALLFDEGYHSHAFYNFETVEDWLGAADVLVFVGTSFAVSLTVTALQHARDAQLPVFNFNLQHDVLASTARLNVSNIVGPATETLPRLVDACRQLREQQSQESKRL
jgi:NAD-dependent deacetylase